MTRRTGHRHPSHRRTGHRWAIAAATVGMLACAMTIPLGPARTARADEVDDLVTELRDLVKQNEETRLLPRISSLEKRRDKRVDDVLMTIVRAPKNERVTKEAMRILALHRDPAFLAWAKTKVNDSKMAADAPIRHVALLDSLAGAGEALKPMVKTLGDCAKDFAMTKPEVSTRAVAALGAVRDRTAVETLFWVHDELENAEGGGGGHGAKPAPPPGGGAYGMSPGAAADMVREAVFRALKDMTGLDHGALLQWKIWWSQNKSTFRFPAREPDWNAIDEYVEDASGLVLRKPAATWTFEKCEFTGGLARLKLADADELQAKVEVMSYPKGDHADAAAFVSTLDEAWRRSEFALFDSDGEPSIANRKIGGRDFVVIAAHGIGAGDWSTWSRCERRVYVTRGSGDTFLALEAVARTAADDAAKSALWKTLESVSFRR